MIFLERNLGLNTNTINREASDKTKGFRLQKLRAIKLMLETLEGQETTIFYTAIEDVEDVSHTKLSGEGVEKYYEEVLRGQKGVKIQMVDVHNRLKGSYEEGKFDTTAIVGANITTTIDAELQAYGEKLLHNKRGSVVAIEPNTGEILALVTSPSYDPSLLVGRERTKNYRKLQLSQEKPLYNRASQGSFNPPGSTFKTVNALIGLQEGVISTKTSLACNGGYRVGSFHQHCHHGGSINFLRSISGSCNAYYSQVYMRILRDNKFDSISHAFVNWRKHLLRMARRYTCRLRSVMFRNIARTTIGSP